MGAVNYNLILWDFDGTLADTAADVWNSVAYAARQLGGEIDADFRADHSNLARPMMEILRHVQPFPGEACLERFDELVRIHYRTLSVYAETELYAGIQEMLQDLREAGACSYIVTMKPVAALERILEAKGWGALFNGWCSPDSRAESVEMPKARVIREILADRGCPSHDVRAVYIGDSWSDVRAAREAGIPCIAVTYGDGDTGRLLAEQPDIVAEHAADIRRALGLGERWD